MPTYNAEQFLDQALASIQKQTYRNFELILCDNCSSDQTLTIVDSFSFPECTLSVKRDQGAADALNRGFEEARGDILCWLNADDVYLRPDVFSIVVQTLQSSSFDFVYGHSCALDFNGFVKKTQFSWTASYNEFVNGMNLFTGSMFFRNNSWAEFGGFDTDLKVAFEYQFFDFLFESKHGVLKDYIFAGLRHHNSSLTNVYQSRIKSELRELRGAYREAHLISNVMRIYRHFQDRNLFRVVANRLKDEHAGKHWTELYYSHGI